MLVKLLSALLVFFDLKKQTNFLNPMVLFACIGEHIVPHVTRRPPIGTKINKHNFKCAPHEETNHLGCKLFIKYIKE